MLKFVDAISKTSWVLLIGINSIGALPRIYKGMYRRVGPSVVQVFRNSGGELEPTVPIQDWAPGPNHSADTGQRVGVMLRNSYKDGQSYFFPWITLTLLFVLHRCNKFKEKSKLQANLPA